MSIKWIICTIECILYGQGCDKSDQTAKLIKMKIRIFRPFTGLLFFAIILSSSLSMHAQEQMTVKSVKSIYNRVDQSKLKLVSDSYKFQLFLDQSKLNIANSLNAQQIVQLASEGKLTALQPNKLRRTVSETEIRVMSKQTLPDEFSLGGVIYHKITLDLGEENGKRVITEAYASGTSPDDIAKAAATLNFQWSSLGIDKTCKNPECIEIRVLEDGTEICITIKCND